MAEPLPDLWARQQRATFPASAMGLAIEGTGLLALDAGIAAILTASLRLDGAPRPIPEAKRRELDRLRGLLRRALAELPLPADARDYFGRLEAIASALLTG